MLETRENWLGRVNICVYHAYQTREIYQVLSLAVRGPEDHVHRWHRSLWYLHNQFKHAMLL